ncbi:dTMP kinase [Streptomyces alfalfae]
MSGRFVTIDGPGGVGKSTVTAALVDQLRAEGVPVYATREPSSSPIGELARHGTDEYRGMVLACLIAADRYRHVEEEVRPALARGDVVVCDRYIPSSLALQVMDGVPRDFVWEINRHTDMPDLAVIVNATADVIDKRLSARGARHSRYEREPGNTGRECAFYFESARFLRAAGVRVLSLDASTVGPEEIARTIAKAIR